MAKVRKAMMICAATVLLGASQTAGAAAAPAAANGEADHWQVPQRAQPQGSARVPLGL